MQNVHNEENKKVNKYKTETPKTGAPKTGAPETRWYKNTWFIFSASVIMLALLVASVLLGKQLSTVERTIFGNKAYYYKMEVENFGGYKDFLSNLDDLPELDDVTNLGGLANDDDSANPSKGLTKGTVKFYDTNSGLFYGLISSGNSLNDLILNIEYRNDDVKTLAEGSISMEKKKSKRKVGMLKLEVDEENTQISFPMSSYATSRYLLSDLIGKKGLNIDKLCGLDWGQIGWGGMDLLQALNSYIPDDCVYHYDEVDFNGQTVERLEFVIDEDVQTQIYNELRVRMTNATLLKAMRRMSASLGQKPSYIEDIAHNLISYMRTEGNISYNVLYDADENILSREFVFPNDRMQILSYWTEGVFNFGLFDQKLGLNIENKAHLSGNSIDGTLVIDVGTDELGVDYILNGFVGEVFPLGTFSVRYGRTGVVDNNSAVPQYELNLVNKKENNIVNTEISFSQANRHLLSVSGQFEILPLDRKLERHEIETADKHSIKHLNQKKLIAEIIWNLLYF